jgi:hypothetical protein
LQSLCASIMARRRLSAGSSGASSSSSHIPVPL